MSLLFTIVSTLFLALRSSTALSAMDDIINVQDIQSNIWCYLTWEQRLIFREVSATCNKVHRHLFSSECGVITQCMDLSLYIRTIDPEHLMEVFASKQHLHYLQCSIFDDKALGDHDSMLIEKLVVDITERAPSFREASRACTSWLKVFSVRFSGFKGRGFNSHRWPTMNINGSVIPCNRNLIKLHRMFKSAKTEMNRTNSKWNRYTRFAFVFLDAFLMSLDTMTPLSITNMVRYLWCDIASVEFIGDYLLRPYLRDFDEPVASAIELIMADAVQLNGTLNKDRLLLMVHHSRILFSFDPIFFELIESSSWNDKSRAECLNFIVDNDLMTWSVMKEHLRDYRAVDSGNPMIEWMWRYVYCRHLSERLRLNQSGNPLTRAGSGVAKNQSFRFRNSVQTKHCCCRCM